MPGKDFERVAEIYDSTRALPESEMSAVEGALTNELRGSDLVLDVAVGTGRFAAPLVAHDFEVVGVDISRAMLAKARQKGVKEILRADAQFLPFRNKVFASSVIVHLLHLVEDWRMVIEEVSRVTREKIVSVLKKTDISGNVPSPWRLYRQFRIEKGVPVTGLEGGESLLAEAIPPARRIRLADTRAVLSPQSEIDGFERREQSITWEVPEPIHARIIDRMRSALAGTSLNPFQQHRGCRLGTNDSGKRGAPII